MSVSIKVGNGAARPVIGNDASAATARRMTLDQVAHGAAGIARAVTGTGGATAETIAARTAICVTCDQAVVQLGVLRRCNLCGCGTWAKVRNAGESCPLNKWPAQASPPTPAGPAAPPTS